MQYENIYALGPYTFVLTSEKNQLIEKTAGNAFILMPHHDIYNEDISIKAAIKLYQDLKKSGYSYVTFLQQIDDDKRMCFAIPVLEEYEEQDEMIRWIVGRNKGSEYVFWENSVSNSLFDIGSVCGYRVAHNLHHADKLRLQGEL